MSTAPVSKTSDSPMVRWAIFGFVLLVAALMVTFIVIHSSAPVEPRLNDNTTVLSKFVMTKTFEQMPFEKQRLYYKVLDDRGAEIDQVYKEGKLTEPEYRNALEAAWLGKHLNRTEKYMAMAPGNARASYIDELITKKIKKDPKNSKGPKPPKDDTEDARVDETAAELRVENWPPSVREQWNQFHKAYHLEKKQREQAATRPAGR